VADTPWLGDTCSLVEEFRSGARSPLEELDATLGAIERSELNAWSFVDADAARDAARRADVSLPFGGVPIGVKELTAVEGWPATEASLVLRDRIATRTATSVERLRAAGAVTAGLTTASEFGGINLTRTKLNGITRNPWNLAHTPGGSSGGAAAAVAGGLCSIATGGDGGGSIRIPAGFTGTLGLKNTYGRIPKGPHMALVAMTAVNGCLARSVRDVARHLDICNGFDARDPYSLPRVEGWEAGLGSYRDGLRAKRCAIVPDLGRAIVHPEIAARVVEHGELLAKDAGFELVDVLVSVPELSYEWALSGLAEIVMELGDRWPDCADDLTTEIGFGVKIAHDVYNIEVRARIEAQRIAMNEAMADLFDRVDFVIAASNPDIAFAAEGPMAREVDGKPVPLGNNGALTIPSNIYGNPAISIPVGGSDRPGLAGGLPIGMQVLAPHHREAWLLDLAAIAEQERPWPLVAPGAPI
jgi:Asp-tRNA(Asn)/Glu-tRNA(Gln) amidotransferase A subunit family amidase